MGIKGSFKDYGQVLYDTSYHMIYATRSQLLHARARPASGPSSSLAWEADVMRARPMTQSTGIYTGVSLRITWRLQLQLRYRVLLRLRRWAIAQTLGLNTSSLTFGRVESVVDRLERRLAALCEFRYRSVIGAVIECPVVRL